jgi:quercetin dioxygenase-like cupin family protein
MFKHLLSGIALAILALAPFLAQGAPSSEDTVVFDHVLPNVPGKSIRGVLVEYPPGGTSAPHTHPHSAFIYATVLEGAIKSQINDGPITVYTAGQNFAELPGDHHRASENASATRPARLLAVFVVDTAETNLVIDDVP